ncbi:MAG: MFS transporter, partial [Bacteroidia bacterium]|nr:MFS transporter [Bacteroidia bacterium]
MPESAKAVANPMPTIFLTVFLDLLGLTLIIPILAPLFIDSNEILGPEVSEGTRNLLYGLVIGIYSLCQFLGAPLLGAASDRVGRKKILYYTLTGTLLSYLIIAFSIWTGSLALLLVGRAIQGLSAGNLSVIYSAIADISKPEEKAKNFGLVGVAFGLGFIIGPVLGGVLSDPSIVSWFSFVTPFLLSAVLVVVNFVMVYARFPETNKNMNPDAPVDLFAGFSNLGRAFLNPSLRAIFVVVFFFTFGFTFFTQFIQVYLIRDFAFKQADIGYLFGYIGFVIAFTQGVLVRALSSKRVAPALILRITLFCLSVAFILLLVPNTTLGLYLLMPLVAINQGIANPNISAMVSNRAPATLQGQTLGMQQS